MIFNGFGCLFVRTYNSFHGFGGMERLECTPLQDLLENGASHYLMILQDSEIASASFCKSRKAPQNKLLVTPIRFDTAVNELSKFESLTAYDRGRSLATSRGGAIMDRLGVAGGQ